MTTAIESKAETTKAITAPSAKIFGNQADGFYPSTGFVVVCGKAHNVSRKRKPTRQAISALKGHIKTATDKASGEIVAESFVNDLDETIATLVKVRLALTTNENGQSASGILINGAHDASRKAQLDALQDSIDQML